MFLRCMEMRSGHGICLVACAQSRRSSIATHGYDLWAVEDASRITLHIGHGQPAYQCSNVCRNRGNPFLDRMQEHFRYIFVGSKFACAFHPLLVRRMMCKQDASARKLSLPPSPALLLLLAHLTINKRDRVSERGTEDCVYCVPVERAAPKRHWKRRKIQNKRKNWFFFVQTVESQVAQTRCRPHAFLFEYCIFENSSRFVRPPWLLPIHFMHISGKFMLCTSNCHTHELILFTLFFHSLSSLRSVVFIWEFEQRILISFILFGPTEYFGKTISSFVPLL